MLTQIETKLMFNALRYLKLLVAVVFSAGISSQAYAKSHGGGGSRDHGSVSHRSSHNNGGSRNDWGSNYDRGGGGNGSSRNDFVMTEEQMEQRKREDLETKMMDSFVAANPEARVDQQDDQSILFHREAERFVRLSENRGGNLSCAPSATEGFVMVCSVPSGKNQGRQVAFRFLTPNLAQKYVKNMSPTPVAVNGSGHAPVVAAAAVPAVAAVAAVASVGGTVCTTYPCSDPSGFSNYLKNNSSVGGRLVPQSSVDFAVGDYRAPASSSATQALGKVSTGSAQ